MVKKRIRRINFKEGTLHEPKRFIKIGDSELDVEGFIRAMSRAFENVINRRLGIYQMNDDGEL